MSKTYVDVGPSTLRIFGFEPAGLTVDDTLICVDMPLDVGTVGVHEARRHNPMPIYPTSQAAFEAIQEAKSLENAATNLSVKWKYALAIQWMQSQLDKNVAYEHDAEINGVRLMGMLGDGRHLKDVLALPADEVLLQNVISDPEVTERDCLQLIRGGLNALAPGGQLTLHDTYTPKYSSRRLREFLNRKLLNNVSISTEKVVDSKVPEAYARYRFNHHSFTYGLDSTVRTVIRLDS